ncbi:MAG: hypothetical protein KGZ35_01170 [Truepera sp.]|nr:hypothetical protein [Truepera sp.]
MRKILVLLMALVLGGALAQGKVNAQPAFTPVLPVGVELGDEELALTEGKVAPLVAIVAWTGARYVVTRYVAPRIAVSALRSGYSVHCSRAQQAASLARQAFGPNNVIRHGPSGHVYSPIHYSHFQAASGFRGAHVFYGRPLR